MADSVWADGFRDDVFGPSKGNGKKCGNSYIPKQQKCKKGQGGGPITVTSKRTGRTYKYNPPRVSAFKRNLVKGAALGTAALYAGALLAKGRGPRKLGRNSRTLGGQVINI